MCFYLGNRESINVENSRNQPDTAGASSRAVQFGMLTIAEAAS